MGKCISKRSTIAILCACVWALIVLCLSKSLRPAEKAHAASLSPNDVITVKAIDGQVPDSGGVTENDISVWGTFYRGVKLFDGADEVTVDYRSKYGNGTVTIKVVEDEENTVTFTHDSKDVNAISEVEYSNGDPCPYYKINQTSNLYTDAWEQDFTTGSYEDCGDGLTHWAVCDDISLQVGHRPDADGNCIDCGAKVDDNYINEYSFTIPESIPETDGWETDGENPYISFDITLDENETKIFEGYTLILKMQSENGALVWGTDTGAYAVSVEDYIGGEATSYDDAGALQSEAQIIWQLTVDESTGNPVEEGVDFRRKFGGTITVTLTLTDPPAYPGEYSDTLTFSVEIEEES